MINVFSLKNNTGKAIDAIDTVNRSVFGLIEKTQIRFLEFHNFWSKIFFMRKSPPEYLLGIGSIGEIFFLPFKSQKTKYVIAWHTLLRKTKAWPIRRFLFQKADFVIAVSECAAETVRKFFPDKKIFVILNGVDANFFCPEKRNKEYLRKKFGIDISRPLVIFVGALFSRKRPDIFIKLAKECKDANFILVGRKDKKDFLNGAKNLSNFQWIPYMSRNDLAVLMASAEVFLFPSVNEPCAAVIPEAMASGLPVLLSKSCGNQELITDNKEGFLIEPDSQELFQFRRYLNQFLTDSILREKMGEQARKKCLNELNWKRAAKQYQEVFYSIYER